jgi:hypothetical protein
MAADSRSAVPADVQARMAMHERHDAERAALTERQAAERAGEGIDPTPIVTWNAFAPDQLADVITGVTRCDPAVSAAMVNRLADLARTGQPQVHEFSTERRDPLSGGALSWKLHLLLAEPEGVA